MSTKLEFKAKNVDKAVELASAELNLPKDELKYEVLSYGSSGIFGLSRTKKAKIRVKLPEDLLASEKKAESAVDDTIKAADKAADVRPSTDTVTLDTDHQMSPPADNPDGQQLFSFPEDPVEMGRLVLQRIVDTITSDAKINVEKDEDRLLYKVNGGNAGILIGKRGQTLDAIQAIVNKVVNKHNQSRTRVLVDIEGYLETRRENLEKTALRLAEKSKKIGKPMTLGPMNAYDRRIVHLALQDFAEVQTRSRGEGPLRKLVILPKNRNAARR
ncbi:MAG: Jag N-terminal domain-containing protein [Deltaproteobacteria bacterium]|jgi:spoIIIJ-associated protein|nr:Jag N-terminal domain-containing protein [Deltaproteobacteria bacterium]MBW2470238.1 Jag N-terminal domain-containing protein [Deltaproteobacteria bacterium]